MDYGIRLFFMLLVALFRNTKQEILGVRLRGGSTQGQGKVEVKRGKQWGAVCGDHWTIREANVVCRELGYVRAMQAQSNSPYGEARGPIWIRNVHCTGSEMALSKCNFLETNKRRRSLYENTDELRFCSYGHQAGVKCMEESLTPPFPTVHLGWQQISAGPSGKRSRLVRIRDKLRWLPICADTWTNKEATVACRQAGLGFAALVEQISSSNKNRFIVTDLSCGGNETSLQSCAMKMGRKRCASYASVLCSQRAPDISVNITILEKSIKIKEKYENTMVCAKEEECISASGFTKSNTELANSNKTRRLLVFSSLVQNFGNADFLPPKVEGGWFYHACHKHYHSMNDFATYELKDHNSKLVEVGHKVSFCLRDNYCVDIRNKKYGCSDDYKIMYQGISIGCGDMYSNDIDCQWIDVTDVPDGIYILEIHSNPYMLVAEQDHTNNFVKCKVTINGSTAFGESCHCPYDFEEYEPRKKTKSKF